MGEEASLVKPMYRASCKQTDGLDSSHLHVWSCLYHPYKSMSFVELCIDLSCMLTLSGSLTLTQATLADVTDFVLRACGASADCASSSHHGFQTVSILSHGLSPMIRMIWGSSLWLRKPSILGHPFFDPSSPLFSAPWSSRQGSVIGKSGRLLELSSTTKITCYKSYPDMPPLDFAPWHERWACHGAEAVSWPRDLGHGISTYDIKYTKIW